MNYTHGTYITVSKDGTINFWTQDFELQKTEVSKNRERRNFSVYLVCINLYTFSANLIVAKTWILDLICMPDVNVICTSSIENDLRFYDIAGNNFLLKIIVTGLPSPISAMNYWFGKTANVDSKIILGDLTGDLAMIEFNPEMKGPFRSTSGVSVGRTTWKAFCEVNKTLNIGLLLKTSRISLNSVCYIEIIYRILGNHSRVPNFNISQQAPRHNSPSRLL